MHPTLIIALLSYFAVLAIAQRAKEHNHTKLPGDQTMTCILFCDLVTLARLPGSTTQNLTNGLNWYQRKYPELNMKDWTPTKLDAHTIKAINNKLHILLLAFRPTDMSNGDDLHNDGMIAVGRDPPRAKEAVNHVREAMRAHPGFIVVLTGHSLGGTIAETVAKEIGGSVMAYAFSTGTSLLKPSDPTPNVRSIYIEGDWVAAHGARNRIVLPPEPNTHPHDIKNFYLKYERGDLQNY